MTEELFKKTKLYQNLYKALGNDIDFDEIVANCLQVITSGKGVKVGVNYAVNSSNVDEAFLWVSTTQGHAYWSGIYRREI